MSHLDTQTVQLLIVAAVAVTMLLQAVALLVGLIIVRKAIRTVHEELGDMRNSVMGVIDKVEPVIDGCRDLLAHTGPKIEAAVSDLAAVSHNLRKETADVQAAAYDIIDRFRRQSIRVDVTLTKIFDAVDQASTFLTEAVSKPVRQLSALLASAKAVVEALRNGTGDAHETVEHAHMDQDGYN